MVPNSSTAYRLFTKSLIPEGLAVNNLKAFCPGGRGLGDEHGCRSRSLPLILLLTFLILEKRRVSYRVWLDLEPLA